MIWLVALCIVQGWQPGAPMPTPGYGFACAAVGDRIYAIGGLTGNTDSTTPRPANEAYDVEADSWITGLAPMPVARAYAGCAVLDDKIYVIGGTDGRREFRRVSRYDPQANTWDTVASLPWPAQALAAAAYQGTLYALGGFCGCGGHGQYLRHCVRYNPGTGNWTEVESLASPRASLAAAATANRLYAVGGRFFNNLPSAEFYQSGRWHPERVMMREPRSGLAAVGTADYLAAIGGMGQQGQLGSVELLDTRTGQWTPLLPLTTPRAFHGAAMVGTKVVVIGGRDMHGTVSTVEAADSLFIMPGIEEEAGPLIRAPRLPSVITAGELRSSNFEVRSFRVHDMCGRLIATASGRARLDLAPGVYFLRFEIPGSGTVTHRLTVVK